MISFARTYVSRKMANLFITQNEEVVIRVVFPFDQVNLDEIRTIQGRKYSKVNKYWTVPLSLENAENLKAFGYEFGTELKNWGNKTYMRIHPKETPAVIETPGLGGTLRPFQKEGLALLERFDGRALLADEMGLGKTVQALAYLFLHPEAVPAVIICPSYLKYNWEKEARVWLNKPSIQILSGETANKILTASILIINYDIVQHWLPALKKIKPQIVIIDESHYIKNSKAIRTKALKQLCKGVPKVIGLSGTPIESKTADIYNIVNIIDSSIFPNQWTFLHEFCDPKYNGFGWTFKGATNSEKLHNILIEKVMIRRLKKDVLTELPDKTYTFVPMQITNRKEYAEAEKDFVEYIRNNAELKLRKQLRELLGDWGMDISHIKDHKLDRLKDEAAAKASPLAQIEVLKQLAVKGKLQAVLNWIEDFLESDEKLVLFCEHRFVIDELMLHFKRIAVKIDGGVDIKDRNEAVNQFQMNKRIRLFIGNKAAETGITLTEASHVAIIEFPWTPGPLRQRIDRCHRIGQKDAVNVYYLMGMGTIEELLAKLLDSKQKIVDSVLDGKETEDIDLLTELIKKYKRQRQRQII